MKNQNYGFSLLEIMAVVAILSFLAISLIPNTPALGNASSSDLRRSQKNLMSGLMRARQLAAHSQQSVLLCGGTCDGNWSQGYSISVNNQLLYSYFYEEPVNVQWQGFPQSKKTIEFLSNGMSSYQNGTFHLCNTTTYAYIKLNQSGRFYGSKALPILSVDEVPNVC